ncbi:hypothetical protein [Novosphingobium sp. CECT 9465]|uniref:hypothetical protein n=1 Tax=Novosphingobium sp. CECT 9465 TaxID=2829794 RepID=UPI001E39883B|nr:hypothetical protein [Novosphingobium sp. CECT 9465]CAH0496650.1 hypothetical protein NVSP9465_01687 [Novosphingobium sp. CECT 9465]
MWLDRDANNAVQQWQSANPMAPIRAAYRRGILRAKVNVHELSCSFATIDCMDSPPVGTMVWLTLPGLEARRAVIEICESFRAFVRFAEPFHPAVLDAVMNGTIIRYH